MVERGEVTKLLAQEPRPARPVGGANRRLSPADLDQLVAEYRGGVGSIYDLADIYGVHRNTIAQHLKDRGVLLGPLPLQDFEVERAQELYGQGLSLNAIGRALGRDPKTVKAAVN
jgi:DNA-binding CsgD family transcriptional regulator